MAPSISGSTKPCGPRDLSLMRIIAHGLIPATRATGVVQAVSRELAIQGQQVSAVPQALLNRSQAKGRSQVDAAFASGSLIRSWPMRGTVHITTAADHHWLRVALLHRMDAWVRNSERNYGVDDRLLEQAQRVALELIAKAGPLKRAELLEAWDQEGLMEAFKGEDVSSYRRRHLLLHLQIRGLLAQGPRQGNEHLVVDVRDLPGAHTGPGGASGGGKGTDGYRSALAEIARRYATSHGPVTAADLSRWTTLPLGESRRALEDAVELTNAADYGLEAAAGQVPLVRAIVEDWPNGELHCLAPEEATPARRLNPELVYLRADLPDLLAENRKDAERTLFIGAFDELHVGYKDRRPLTDEAGEQLICPGKNGMFLPFLVDRGRLVAVRPAGRGLNWAPGARRSGRLERDVERALSEMNQRLGL
ncbi:Uncharacterised protein [Actinomyces bovis]|uniref:Winged helix DNA-binding domain-containing protein n=1 Tax=Actinomyces bovis TaxID=1658 RepID=A0ABY1VMU5_9ACTO|nr:crosslink repair DNA glycosylase YcaQ family protein [Actinomyces bovis]SPT53431.1 Uncharacterised protein [Actinomyces bovis]VEG52887.1 Uncharacterised protein [Actinomyces israelii]